MHPSPPPLHSHFHSLISLPHFSISDAVEWAGAWAYKMESFGGNAPNTDSRTTAALQIAPSSSSAGEKEKEKENTREEENVQLCAYCGFEERFLGNQFVMVRKATNYVFPSHFNMPLSNSLYLSLSLSLSLSGSDMGGMGR